NVVVPELEGCFTWGRSLSAARRNVREAIEASLDDDPRRARTAKEADVVEVVDLPGPAKARLKKIETLRYSATEAMAKKSAAEKLAAVYLVKETSLSLRDAGALLGLSQEGVRKLLKRTPEAKPVRMSR
ncbi:MAG: hypothetical protein ACREJX_01130, partial [Polyangiaceae bacterium]